MQGLSINTNSLNKALPFLSWIPVANMLSELKVLIFNKEVIQDDLIRVLTYADRYGISFGVSPCTLSIS